MEPARNDPPRLDAESSDFSTRTLSSTSTFIPSPLSNRYNYESLPGEEEDTSYRGAADTAQQGPESDSAHGLRIQFSDPDPTRMSIGATVPKDSPEIADSQPDLLSPRSARSRHFSLPGQGTPLSPDDPSTTYGRSSPNSFYSPHAYDDNESTRRLRASTIGSLDPRRALDELVCRTRRPIQTETSGWLSLTIIFLALYSTVFSAIWLGLAVAKPRYGRHIMDVGGKLKPSTASTLFAGFAKTIELSFVTVFVTALGQILSNTALRKNSKGITIADMLLRQWIQQPGSLITHWEAVRFSALTMLGALTLTATLISMFYTTASDALVAPTLKFGGYKQKVLLGEVKTIFGNNTYQKARCKTPITEEQDPWEASAGCMEIEHSGQAYHNIAQYLDSWDRFKSTRESIKMSERPPPLAMLWDNTTITGSWVEEIDTQTVSAKYNRIVNNVTLAMPLTAVVGAASAKNNSILQPQDFKGLGEYNVNASVPSPSINVICAELTSEELKPLVYTEWPDYNQTSPNATNWPEQFDDKIPRMPSYLNRTTVDDLFGWGEAYGRRPPIFPLIPKEFQSVLNSSSQLDDSDIYGDSIYLLFRNNATKSNQVCSIRSTMYPYCSTQYHASRTGGNLTTRCNEPHNSLQYSVSHPDATTGVTNHNWTQVANRWVTTMSLGAGVSDGRASNARLLTQLMLLDRQLDPKKPSIAEALAVQAGCTVILSGLDSPFIHYWNLSDQINFPSSPIWQSFSAMVRSQEYSSGPQQPWQGVFYLVLVGTLLLNVSCLLYFLINKGFITDYMEPHNLFSLAINSPASRALEGSCGGGPETEQLRSTWHIDFLGGKDHFYVHSTDDTLEPRLRQRKGMVNRNSGWEMGVEGSPVSEQYERLSKKPSSLF